MPSPIIGNLNPTNTAKFKRPSRRKKSLYRDRYPGRKDFTPGTPLHNKIVSEVLIRARTSETVMSNRHSSWGEIDRFLTAYIPFDDAEKLRLEDDIRDPVSIVMPEMYAQMDIFLAYMTAVFGVDPIHEYDGVDPDDELGAILLEGQIAQQARKNRSLLAHIQQWRDMFAYGLGPLALSWEVKDRIRTFSEPIMSLNPITGRFEQVGIDKKRQPEVAYEGNKWEALDPYTYLPDPSVNISEPQKGEFLGWVERTTFNQLKRRESELGSFIFNVDYMKDNRGRSSIYVKNVKEREADGSIFDQTDSGLTQTADVVWMYWDIIPRDFDLGTSEEPEKWLFGLANDNLIIAADRIDLDHDMFPVVVGAPETGGHEFMPPSKMDFIRGPQQLINFYINSNIREIRNFLKNKFIVDPKSVRMDDLYGNKAVIRTRRAAWQRGVDDILKQIPMQDVTQNFMGNMNGVQQMSRNASGAVDSLMGIQRTSSERVTAAEFQGTQGGAISRLQKMARIYSEQSMLPEGIMLAYHTQQFLTQDTYIKTAGRNEQVLREEYGILDPSIRVTPFDLNINFDVMVNDGSTISGETAEGWMTWMQILTQSEELTQANDLQRISQHIARLLGNRVPHEFVRKRPLPQLVGQQVANDELQGLIDSGDLVSVEDAANAI